MTLRVLTVVGARPQFIKAATISRVIAKSDGIRECIVHTGQHYDPSMSDTFFEQLSIPAPAHNLGISGSSHGKMTGQMLEQIEDVLLKERPDMMIIYGDTNSTLAGALAAAKLHIPIAHIEAGLRSFNRKMPEEINRVASDHMSTLLLCPTKIAVQNLHNEGVSQHVSQVGDVMYDATIFAGEQSSSKSTILETLDLETKRYSLATIHRAENTDTDDNLKAVMEYLEQHGSDAPVVLPLHPRTKGALNRMGRSFNNIRFIDPVSYFDMHQLLANAKSVLTDSGGLQKEAYFHGVPCVTIRDETEWVETIDAGWNRLWSNDQYNARSEIKDYGTGQAAEECIRVIRDYFA